jgi:hypothetical protein
VLPHLHPLPLAVHLNRDPGGRKPQQLLNDLHVFAVLTEQARDGMKEGVPADVLLHPALIAAAQM